MIKLRALTAADAHKTWEWRNREDIRFFFAGHPFPINFEKEAKWIDSVLFQNQPHSYFGIEQDDELIGIISLRDISMLNRNAEYALFVVGGKGAGREATKLILEFAFFDLGLERVWLKVMTNNKAAINLYRKCGFVEEGVLRKSIYKKGEFYDQLIFAVLKTEYKTIEA